MQTKGTDWTYCWTHQASLNNPSSSLFGKEVSLINKPCMETSSTGVWGFQSEKVFHRFY